jgi:predicted O-methyltransferase YrrM
MDIFSQEIENYITSHIEPEPEFLKKLVRDTNLYTLKPRMLSGHLQGRLLKMFCAMTGAKRVVEIGTFTGYSALCMAEALPEDGEVHTIDINDELEELILNGFDRAGDVGKKVHFHIGDAAKLIPQMEGEFDVCFMDGNKRHYMEYLEAVYPKMKMGGLIIADNTLWDGHVLEEDRNDAQTAGIKKFNDSVCADDRFFVTMVPLRDGMTLIRKIK